MLKCRLCPRAYITAKPTKNPHFEIRIDQMSILWITIIFWTGLMAPQCSILWFEKWRQFVMIGIISIARHQSPIDGLSIVQSYATRLYFHCGAHFQYFDLFCIHHQRIERSEKFPFDFMVKSIKQLDLTGLMWLQMSKTNEQIEEWCQDFTSSYHEMSISIDQQFRMNNNIESWKNEKKETSRRSKTCAHTHSRCDMIKSIQFLLRHKLVFPCCKSSHTKRILLFPVSLYCCVDFLHRRVK